jgi:hypothetical protein
MSALQSLMPPSACAEPAPIDWLGRRFAPKAD